MDAQSSDPEKPPNPDLDRDIETVAVRTVAFPGDAMRSSVPLVWR
jgi:hypothetical protein